MRQLVLSNCEREFLLRSVVENARLDGRSCTDHRKITITLSDERGSCFVIQGNTKVFAQVSSNIIVPKSGRAAEGALFVNLELSPMAAPQFESGRLGDVGVETCRLLERSLKQSRCLDLESLCIVAGEKVWEIRIDIHILDYDGAIIDAASVAAICALRHFRRPDVTLNGGRVEVHTVEEKEPIPLNLYHYPLCITFGFCEQVDHLIVEPTEKEEMVIDGKIVVAMNSHRELCAVHCGGNSMFKKEKILRCTARAAQRAKELTEIINKVFEEDTEARSSKTKIGFPSLIGFDLITGASQSKPHPEPLPAERSDTKVKTEKPETSQKSPVVVKKGKVARVTNTKVQVRLPTENDDSDIEVIAETASATALSVIQPDEENHEVKLLETKKKRKGKAKLPDREVQSLLDEIEDDVQVLMPSESGYQTRPKTENPDSSVEVIDLSGALRSKLGKEKTKRK